MVKVEWMVFPLYLVNIYLVGALFSCKIHGKSKAMPLLLHFVYSGEHIDICDGTGALEVKI